MAANLTVNTTYEKKTYICVGDVPSPEQSSYIINVLIDLTFTIPCLILNGIIVIKYHRLPVEEKKRNSMFLIFNQAIVDLFNGLLNTPYSAVGCVLYYTNFFGKNTTEDREESCKVWYLISSWSAVVSLISSLLLLLLIAMERFVAVWRPVFWYSHLRYGAWRLNISVLLLWFSTVLFALGEIWVHYIEFYAKKKSKQPAEKYHFIWAVISFFLTSLVVIIWTLTFYKSYHFLRASSPRSTTDPQDDVFSTKNSISPNVAPAPYIIEAKSSTSAYPDHYKKKPKVRLTRRVSSQVPPSSIVRKEMNLIRVFVAMLVLFLAAYTPMLAYFIIRLKSKTSFSTSDSHIIWATALTLLNMASVMNPLIVMARIANFKWGEKDRVRRRSQSSGTFEITETDNISPSLYKK